MIRPAFLLTMTFLTGLSALTPSYAQDSSAPDASVINEVATDPATPVMGAGDSVEIIDGANGEMVSALPDPHARTAGMSRIEREINERLDFLKPSVDVNSMPSLFMSVWEHDLVIDARRGLVTRDPVTDDGITESGPRDVSLGGIVYLARGEWTIWLNSMRVSPTAIPDQIIDLKVFKDYIELEWFDAPTNQIYPIRLRPHQRFNLDTRMFLPG